jgi:nitroreductase
MVFSKPITEIIQARYSCRTYEERVIADDTRQRLSHIATSIGVGPFGTSPRFELVAATEEDRAALKGLGTYGFIKGATGFLVGATTDAEGSIEDYGYLMELLVLHATDLGLGTCWLGGSFTKSSFAAKIGTRDTEQVPAVVSVGYIAERPRALDPMIRRYARSDQRLPWQRLFFESSFRTPLSKDEAGSYSMPLDMMRLAPSASNKQPWRIVRVGDSWHFYLARTKGYGQGRFGKSWAGADMQRLDMGIAMCHFEQAASEIGLAGRWVVDAPDIGSLDDLAEYTASWIG